MNTEIKSSWKKNAEEWIKAIQNETIASRQFTNKAILNTIKNSSCDDVVDIGCGEGWLSRALKQINISATGIDSNHRLIGEAKKHDASNYFVLSFEDIIEGKPLPNAPFEAAIFNFCIYFKSELKPLLKQTLNSVVSNGFILIQTVHPFFLIQNKLDYKSQWIHDSWKGLPGKFKDGHSWYARTFEDWFGVLSSLSNTELSVQEVLNDEQIPVSVIFKIKKL